MGGAFGAGKAVHDNWANRKTLGLGGMIKTAFAGFTSGTITGMAAGATFSAGGMVLKAGGSLTASMLTGFAVGAGTGAASGAAGSAIYQGITAGQVNKEQVKLAAISTGAGLAAAGTAAPALGIGNKAVSKVLGKALQRFGMGESAATAAAGIAATAFGGGAVGGTMGAGGNIAEQGYLISQGYQNSFNWKQFGKTTCGAVITGTTMGAAVGAFGQTKTGSRFFQWLETPTQFEQNAAKGIKQFLGDNRGTASIEALLGKKDATDNLLPQIDGNSYDISKLQKTQSYTYQNEVSAIKAEIAKNGPNSVPPIKIRIDHGRVLVVDGHHRLEAFQQLGYNRVPIQYLHDSQLGKSYSDGTYYRTLQELLDGAGISK